MINISGLQKCYGLRLIVLYVQDELSYDRYNERADRIVRLAQHEAWEGGNMHIAVTSAPFAALLKQKFPQIEDAVRIDPEGGGVIARGNGTIRVNDIIAADSSFFKIFSFDFMEGNAGTALTDPKSFH